MEEYILNALDWYSSHTESERVDALADMAFQLQKLMAENAELRAGLGLTHDEEIE